MSERDGFNQRVTKRAAGRFAARRSGRYAGEIMGKRKGPQICPACGGELRCLRCHLSRAGEIGGARKTPARLAAAKAASRAPRPGRRAYDLDWSPARRGLPERASLAEAIRQAIARRAGADLVRDGKVVGRVEQDGSWSLVEGQQ